MDDRVVCSSEVMLNLWKVINKPQQIIDKITIILFNVHVPNIN